MRTQRPGDPFAGASITITAGALSALVIIVIRAGAGAPPIRGFIPVGPILGLEPAGLAFATDVTVVLPYRAALLPAGVPETQVQAYLTSEYSWAVPSMCAAVSQLALQWYNHVQNPNHNELMVKDMSLPWGGVLSIHADWDPDQQEHREGHNADVSYINSGVNPNDPNAVRHFVDLAISIPGCSSSADHVTHVHMRCF